MTAATAWNIIGYVGKDFKIVISNDYRMPRADNSNCPPSHSLVSLFIAYMDQLERMEQISILGMLFSYKANQFPVPLVLNEFLMDMETKLTYNDLQGTFYTYINHLPRRDQRRIIETIQWML